MALILLVAIGVRADFIHPVTGSQNLAVVAEKIRNTIDSGTHVVRISAYAQAGQFQFVTPNAKVQTLIFERDSLQESDSSLRVSGDTALLEIKNMRSGTVILRGLAFHLASPQSRLLAGAEPGKENFHLIIDSCFIFGDSNASSFLTWLGTAGSRIDIRRSFFVFKSGDGLMSKSILTSTSLNLVNNLFHYNGQMSASVLPGGIAEIHSNTVHRTQFRLNSETYQRAHYVVARNFIGHRPAQDAFGTAEPYFFWATNFHPDDSYARRNVILRSWPGFDHPGAIPLPFAADTTNKSRDSITVKPVTELWNWYGPTGTIDSTGHAFGRDRRPEEYNIFPGAASSPFIFEGNPGSVHFKPALFPRQFAAVRTPMPVPTGHDSVRFHTPHRGALRFGSFQVDSIQFSMATFYGHAQLFSSDSDLRFHPQGIGSATPPMPHVFANNRAEARYFFIGFKGNTPRGKEISPDGSSSLGIGDTLSYGNVDSAGYTGVYEEALQAYPDSLRNLGRNIAARTTAAVSGAMVFGSTEGVKPHWSDQVYWWRPKDSLLHLASSAESGRYVTITEVARDFSAYLVEKLTVKRGKTTVFPLADGGEVRASSVNGYQLRIDSLYVPDSLRFGNASKGYSLAFTGRQAGDTLILKLPGGPDSEVFRVVEGALPTVVPATVDSMGFHSLPIAPGDSNIRLFSGIRFNVIAGITFDDILGGVRIASLKSASSGRIGILPFNTALLGGGIGTDDTLPSNAKLLGAKGIRTRSLSLAGPWSASFPVSRPGDSTRVVAYAWDGLRWRLLPPPVFMTGESTQPTLFGLGSTDQAMAVFELLKPASEYVRMEPVEGNRTLSVTVTDNNDVHKLIKSFSLRVLHVNELGQVVVLPQGPVPVGQTLTQDLTDRSGLFLYAVIYQTAEGDYNLPAYVPITKFSWNPAGMSVGGTPVKAGQQWHLLGSPYPSTLDRTLSQGDRSDPKAKDTLEILSLKTVNDTAEWETVANPKSLKLNPGDAFLFSSARMQEHLLDTAAEFVVTRVKDLGPHTGWRFVSPPYPMSFPTSAVGSNHPEMGRFLELKVDHLPQPIEGRVRHYTWVMADRLKPFTGYAYKFAADEVLTFNPWYALAPAPVPKRGDNGVPLGSVEVKLEVEGRTRSMQLWAGGGIRELPYLPAPGGGLEMQVGGKGGWFVKKVDDLLGIDESVVIRSPAISRGRLELGLAGLPAQRKDWRARLIHLASGRILDPSAGFPLSKGAEEYRLVAGTEAFLAERISAFKSGLPPGLTLSQNFPNPFRSHTRIHLEWPALAGEAAGGGRKAKMEVFDARGRRIHSLDLGEIRAGRQVITLDGSRWEPGLYTYRLTVDQRGTRAHLQKRMLVSP